MLPAATNTPMLRAGFDGNPAGACPCSQTACVHASVLTGRATGFEALSKFHPLGRICEPEEIAQVRAAATVS